ncbi:hypothetical protein DSM112329_03405 [Paraconexibacter sp. AEG42_29]|uniref:Uncharacterized protein n=1 Tax=Paraconexibacter sp. AEG42_29 TaxID=2997339 RepID=A0AAU7AXR9_9ACTN
MPESPSPDRKATFVGVGSGVIGAALLVKPDALGPLLGLARRRDAQLVGVVDLALAPGIVIGRPRWPWMAARAAANVGIAALCVARDREQLGRRGHHAAAALLAVTLADLKVAGDLRAGR